VRGCSQLTHAKARELHGKAANWARVSREVVHGGVRSYVEHFICSVKDRLRGFDAYFPSPSESLSSALKLLYAWVGFYKLVQVVVREWLS